jgi:hypothetical protein
VHLSIYRTQVSVSLLFAPGQRCKAHIETLQENDKRIEAQMAQVTFFVTWLKSQSLEFFVMTPDCQKLSEICRTSKKSFKNSYTEKGARSCC